MVKSFWEGLGKGSSAWLDGEGAFLSGAWGEIKSIPGAVVDGIEAVPDYAGALWQNLGRIMELARAFMDGEIARIQNILGSLVRFPGELGELLDEVVTKSAEWAMVMNEMVRQTDAVEAVGAAVFGSLLLVPPTFWADMIGAVGGYIVPEIILAAVFAVIGYFTAGAGAAALTARLAAYRQGGRRARQGWQGRHSDPAHIRVFGELAGDSRKLAVAVQKNIREAADSATDVITRIVRRSGKRDKFSADTPCFAKPGGASDWEFLGQLKEQENAINNSDITELIDRRKLVKDLEGKGGTGKLRDKGAQQAVRKNGWLLVSAS